MKQTLEQRFWSKVDKRGPDECWPWLASRMKKNGRLWYGKFGRGGKHGGWEQSQRVAYALTHGEIRSGIQICHSCDNPPCCNPAHLFPGTLLDNLRDKVSKGRHRWKTHYGQDAGNWRLTSAQVGEVWCRFNAGESRAALARAFGVSWTNISNIVTGKARVRDVERAVLERRVSAA